MKTAKKFAIGILIIILGGGLGLGSVELFHFEFCYVIVGFAVLVSIGSNMITENATPKINLVPERRYKLINYSVTNNGRYTTFYYKNAYGIEVVHTFLNVLFEKYEEETEGFVAGYAPVVGRIYTACKEEGNKEIVLKHI